MWRRSPRSAPAVTRLLYSRFRMHLWPCESSAQHSKRLPPARAALRLSLPKRDPRSRERLRRMICGPNDHIHPHTAHRQRQHRAAAHTTAASTKSHSLLPHTHGSLRSPARRTLRKCSADADSVALGHWFEQLAVPQCAAGHRGSSTARG